MALILSRDDVRSLIDMPAVIEAVALAHADHAAGRAAQPTRTTVPLADSPNAILPMAATVPSSDAAGLKLLSIFPTNRDAGLPVLNAVVVLVDPTYCLGCRYCIQACPYGCRFLNKETRTAEKCTLCYHRITKGLTTACCENCPTGARQLVDLKNPADPIHEFLKFQSTKDAWASLVHHSTY